VKREGNAKIANAEDSATRKKLLNGGGPDKEINKSCCVCKPQRKKKDERKKKGSKHWPVEAEKARMSVVRFIWSSGWGRLSQVWKQKKEGEGGGGGTRTGHSFDLTGNLNTTGSVERTLHLEESSIKERAMDTKPEATP